MIVPEGIALLHEIDGRNYHYNIITNLTDSLVPGNPTNVIISLAVVVPLLLVTFVCYCTLRRKQGTNFKLILKHQRHSYEWWTEQKYFFVTCVFVYPKRHVVFNSFNQRT